MSKAELGKPLKDQGPKTNQKLNFKAHCVRIMWPMFEEAKGQPAEGSTSQSVSQPVTYV